MILITAKCKSSENERKTAENFELQKDLDKNILSLLRSCRQLQEIFTDALQLFNLK